MIRHRYQVVLALRLVYGLNRLVRRERQQITLLKRRVLCAHELLHLERFLDVVSRLKRLVEWCFAKIIITAPLLDSACWLVSELFRILHRLRVRLLHKDGLFVFVEVGKVLRRGRRLYLRTLDLHDPRV